MAMGSNIPKSIRIKLYHDRNKCKLTTPVLFGGKGALPPNKRCTVLPDNGSTVFSRDEWAILPLDRVAVLPSGRDEAPTSDSVMEDRFL